MRRWGGSAHGGGSVHSGWERDTHVRTQRCSEISRSSPSAPDGGTTRGQPVTRSLAYSAWSASASCSWVAGPASGRVAATGRSGGHDGRHDAHFGETGHPHGSTSATSSPQRMALRDHARSTTRVTPRRRSMSRGRTVSRPTCRWTRSSPARPLTTTTTPQPGQHRSSLRPPPIYGGVGRPVQPEPWSRAATPASIVTSTAEQFVGPPSSSSAPSEQFVGFG